MLRLTYRYPGDNLPVEVEGILPETLRALTRTEIERLAIWHGNARVPLGELFEVEGTLEGPDRPTTAGDLPPGDRPRERGRSCGGTLVWSGSLEHVHWIGAGMREGQIVIEGSAGRHVGSEMRGGSLCVEGSVGDWAGAGMAGGLLHIRGDAGNLVGSGYRGSPVGMTGGMLLVEGRAGNEIGQGMRRGLMAIGGDAGDLVGVNMRAGTILVGGRRGCRPGAGMRRGTLVFLGDSPHPLLPSFRGGAKLQTVAWTLLARQLRHTRFPLPESADHVAFQLYHGDLLEGGRGEIWLAEAVRGG